MTSPMALRPTALRRCLPFAVFIALLGLRGALPADGSAGFDPRWLAAAAPLIVAALLLAFRHDYGELSAQTRPGAGEAALAIATGVLVFALWIHLDEPWMRLGEATAGFRPVDADGRLIWPLVALRWAGAALVVPVMEELFWRSFLMRWLQHPVFESVPPQQVRAKAIVLVTFLFVLAHTLWLGAALAGLAYAWLYRRSGRLWTAVIAHAVTNALLGGWVVLTGNWGFW